MLLLQPSSGLSLAEGHFSDRRRVSYSGSTAVFQTVGGGSIPPTRSTIKLFANLPSISVAAHSATQADCPDKPSPPGARKRASRLGKTRVDLRTILILSRFICFAQLLTKKYEHEQQ